MGEQESPVSGEPGDRPDWWTEEELARRQERRQAASEPGATARGHDPARLQRNVCGGPGPR